MKRFLLIIFALCIMLLCGCQAANNDVITPASPVDPPSNIRIGMTFDEFLELYPDKQWTPGATCFYTNNEYALFEDGDGNPVVVHFVPVEINHFVVGSVYAFDKNGINKSEAVFNALEGGMSIQEVISLVGLPEPYCINRTGVFTWKLNDGVEYVISFTPINGGEYDEVGLCQLSRWVGDEWSYPIGEEPWYAPEQTKP